MRLYMCDGGTFTVPIRTQILGAGGDGAVMPTPVSWFVITHPRGNIIVDGGNAPEVAIDPRKHWGKLQRSASVEMTPDQAVLPTLARIAIAPESIRWILQTHLHKEHTGAIAVIDKLPNARVLVTRTEYEWALAAHRQVPVRANATIDYCPADYVKPGVDWVMLEEGEDGWDLYDDGCVRCWRTPGHTPGHMSVEIKLSNSAFILAADAVNTIAHVDETVLPGSSADMVSGGRSIRRIRRLADRAQARIIPGHDSELWATVAKPPEFYS